MTLRKALALGSAALVAGLALASNDARACGGCFHPENQADATVVTGHRMAFSISTKQTVLWDQVQYSGSPADFAWVLPVKAGAVLELSNDAWFETLDAATETRVLPKQLACGFSGGGFDEGGGNSGCGCGSGSADTAPTAADSFGGGAGAGSNAPPPVQVLHEGTVGPYDTVTLKANVPGALTAWLQKNGYAISSSEQPLVDAYVAEGFDFIALRLKPDAGVQQMKPVRVVTPGAVPALPLRMVAAGTGANVAITLFVVSEGRWETQNFPNALVDPKLVAWDFNASKSNYAKLRDATLAADTKAWLTSYAQTGTLFSPALIPNQGQVPYTLTNNSTFTTIADAYIGQGQLDGEAQGCSNSFAQYASSADQVVDLCDAMGQNCTTPAPGQIDARSLACGTLDDIAVALTGLHPKDVWLTRLEANLPHAALDADLVIDAAKQQTTVPNWLTAQKAVNPPCTDADAGAAAFLPFRPPSSGGPAGGGKGARRLRGLEVLGLAAAVVALAIARRRSRRAVPEAAPFGAAFARVRSR